MNDIKNNSGINKIKLTTESFNLFTFSNFFSSWKYIPKYINTIKIKSSLKTKKIMIANIEVT
jgi:hypothetical protein